MRARKSPLHRFGKSQHDMLHRGWARHCRSFEQLEARCLLTITWSNRGSDNFSIYGASEAAARAIVDQAISYWNSAVTDTTALSLTLSAGSLSGSLRGQTSSVTPDNSSPGKKTAATVTLDNNGGGAGWFFDATPSTHTEFNWELNDYAAYTTTFSTADFLTTALREIGHGLGLTKTSAATLIGANPNGDSGNPLYSDGGAVVTGYGDLWEGPYVGNNRAPIPEVVRSTYSPSDLMNSEPVDGGRRFLISPSDISFLSTRYGYSVGSAPASVSPTNPLLKTLVSGGVLNLWFNYSSPTYPHILELSAGAGGTVVPKTDGKLGTPISLFGATTIDFGEGFPANKTLILDYSNGDPLPSGGLTVGTKASGYHALLIREAAGSTTAHSYSIANGNLVRDSTTISLANVDWVGIYGGGGNDTFEYASGSVQAVLAGGGGNDTFNIGGTGTGTLNSVDSLVDIYGEAGSDTLNVNDQSSTSNYTYTFTNSSVSRALSGVTDFNLTYGSGLESFVLNTTSTTSATVNVTSTASSTNVFINESSSNDGVNVGGSSTGTLENILGNVTIDTKGGTNDGININDQNGPVARTYAVTGTTISRDSGATITYTNSERIYLNGTTHSDIFNLASSVASTSTNLWGNSGNDVFNIGATGTGTLNSVDTLVDISGGAGTDTLNVNDQSSTNNYTYGISSSSITRALSGATDVTLSYPVGLETIVLNTTAALSAIVNVTSTASGTSVFINQSSSNDGVNIGGDGTGTLAYILGNVTIDSMGSGNDGININDQNGTSGRTYTISGTSVNRGSDGIIAYSNSERIYVNGTIYADTFNLTSSAASTSTNLWGNSGNDTFNIGGSVTGTLNSVSAPVDISGGAGTDTLNINDQSSSNNYTYSVANSAITRALGGTTDVALTLPVGLEAIVLNTTSTPAAVVNLNSTASGVGVTICGGSSNDIVNVGGSSTGTLDGILGNVSVDFASGTNDALYVLDQLGAAGRTYAITGTTIGRGTGGTTTYSNAKSVNVYGTTFADTFNLTASASGVQTNLWGNSGNDIFNVGGSGTGTLNAVVGGVDISGGADTDTLNVNDQNSTSSYAYTLTNSSVTRKLGGVTNFSLTYPAGLEALNLSAGSGGDAISAATTTWGITINGGAGDDSIAGGTGNDALNGGDGDDEISGGLGADIMHGNAGADTIFDYVDGANDSATDSIFGDADADDLFGDTLDLITQ